MRKSLLLILIFWMSSFAEDQLPPLEQVNETIKCPDGRVRMYINFTLDEIGYSGGLFGNSDYNIKNLTFSKGNIEIKPVSFAYYLHKSDTVIDNTLLLKKFDSRIFVGWVGLNIYDTATYTLYPRFGIKFSNKYKFNDKKWIFAYFWTDYNTAPVLNSTLYFELGNQFSNKFSISIISESNMFVNHSKFISNYYGKEYYETNTGLAFSYNFNRWCGFFVEPEYSFSKKKTFPRGCMGLKLINWKPLEYMSAKKG